MKQDINKQADKKEFEDEITNETSENTQFVDEEAENVVEQTEERVENVQSEEREEDSKIKQLEAKLEEAENRYLRLYADFENSRRRARQELEASEKYKSQTLITELLPAIDNFERALAIEPENEQSKALLNGVEMVYRSIIDALKKAGAEQIDAVGKQFDPNYHQAVMQTSEEQFESNEIVEEFQKGYILKDRVIRPSMVKVNQ
ncbi:nucleotide exchange factor GrpE [Lederbergia galactosidilytica]|uniref:Protein GrpE n=1 Tax=Lederbergia galactosidilytica TaxID=217031 RepID=A0A0Q9Y7I7_9BACI|nr:nucleotide exchange factor GrpE [Lederbergia galactosidilytica]KRG15536.1 heat shock protein GrpE [Virgibacillus soli]KRG16789.1 heat shock protein GrpE [Lederbergia galactosidilytica]MBP1914834.1 molecular chaperone GrpE [Lederbergia galactosidilytica]OAK74730.1 heat shock protein GrpE [Lederbergia galactosidilytica]